MDFKKYKNDFPLLRENPNLSYLDSAAMALKPDCVINSVDNYYRKYGCNVHRGVYELSYEATELYENARKTIAEFLNADIEEIIFTRGTTSSLNLVASSYSSFINEGDEIITTELEHHSSHMPWFNVAKKKKAIIKYVSLNNDNRITLEEFKKVLTKNTKVVAITYVSNVMGFITPLKEIIKLAHEYNAKVIVDAAQAVPHMNVDVKDLDCDFLAFSGHKICGPTGIGVLYGKKELLNMMDPIEFGGDMADEVDMDNQTYKTIPYKFEAGTPIIAGAIGMAEAIKYVSNIGLSNINIYEYELKQKATNELSKIDGITIYNKTAETGIIAFNIDGVHPHDAASVFDNNNVCIRAGHHCAQLITKHLGVLGTIRASFYFYNDMNDVNNFIKAVKEAKDFFGKF